MDIDFRGFLKSDLYISELLEAENVLLKMIIVKGQQLSPPGLKFGKGYQPDKQHF
jgi:hypothetical protein